MILETHAGAVNAAALLQDLVSFVERAAEQRSRIDLVERGIFDRLLRIGREALVLFLQLSGDGRCGDAVEVGGVSYPALDRLHARRYLSIFGEVEVERVVYAEREGQKIQAAPLDARLGLPVNDYSLLLEDWIGSLSTTAPFQHAVGCIQRILGLRVGVRGAEEVLRRQAAAAESFQPPAPEPAEPGRLVVVQADGKGVPMIPGERPEKAEGRPGVKRMACVGAAYSIDPFVRTPEDVLGECDDGTRPAGRPEPRDKRVLGELTREVDGEQCSGRTLAFARLEEMARALDPDGVAAAVCLFDGERMLWNQMRIWFPNAVGVLDWFHVSQYVWEAASALHPSLAARDAFSRRIRLLLLEGRTLKAARELESLAADPKTRKGAAKTLRKAARYFRRHRKWMKYDEYLEAGLPIGTGAVEGTCRNLVKDRMEGTGMKWSREGAQAMLATRAIHLNGHWDAFMEHRIREEVVSFYAVTP